MSRIWPGITPMNVWDMEFGMWRRFAAECDDYERLALEAKRQREDGGR